MSSDTPKTSTQATARGVVTQVVMLAAVLFAGCGRSPSVPATASLEQTTPKPSATSPDIADQVKTFCGGCHAVPQSESFPKAMWYDEVQRGYDFYYQSGRTDLKAPVLSQVTAYFRDRAPEQLVWNPADFIQTPSPIRFDREPPDDLSSVSAEAPAVSFLAWDATDSVGHALWFSDMRSGQIVARSLQTPTARVLTHPAKNPVTVRRCDLDGNGRDDLVIADLGSFLPEDHDRGQVVWLRDGAEEANPESRVILAKVGRVADVRAADFDGDGDLDLVVAEFGWHRTGGVHVLWNEGRQDTSELQFRTELLDRRPGAIHVPTVDLDGDGRTDIVVLLSQEHETILAYMNRPQGFERQTIRESSDPALGSSGIEVVDLDADGDLDVVYTFGDTFDSHILKPYHGVSWLENRGNGLSFTEHVLTRLPGVHRAIPADLDGDGDLDLAVSAFVSDKLRTTEAAEWLDAVIWLEQVAAGRFERHRISREDSCHAAMTVGDIDADGDVDLILGVLADKTTEQKRSSIVVFRNLGRSGFNTASE